MNQKLSIHLFRTLISKPKGLRMKLTIRVVNREMEMFDEVQNPGATLMPHSLFLALPTKIGVKDPMLLGILNQSGLKDHEPHTEVEVNWISQRPDGSENTEANQYLGKRGFRSTSKAVRKRSIEHQRRTDNRKRPWRNTISLSRNGMIKHICQSELFDSIVSEYLKSESGRNTIPITYVQSLPGFPTLITHPPFDSVQLPQQNAQPLHSNGEDKDKVFPFFLSFMDYISYQHKQHRSRSENLESMDPQTSKSGPNSESFCLDLSPISFVGKHLANLLATLLYWRQFVAPADLHALEEFQSRVKMLQDRMYDLSSVVLKIFIEPIYKAVAGFLNKTLEDSQPKPPINVEHLDWVKKHLQRLMRLSRLPLGEFPEGELIDSPGQPGYLEKSLLRCVSVCWEIPALASKFFQEVEGRLAAYSSNFRQHQLAKAYVLNQPSEYQQKVGHFVRSYITHGYSRIGDWFLRTLSDHRFCVVRSAKQSNAVRFSPDLKNHQPWNLIAIMCRQDVKVCLMQENIRHEQRSTEMSSSQIGTENSTIHTLLVFRGDTQVGSFTVPLNKVLGIPICGFRTIQYFTKRYFIKFHRADECFQSHILVLDLETCLQAYPKPAICYSMQLENLVADRNHIPFSFACTDKFLSYIATTMDETDTNGELTGKPILLQIIKFDGQFGLLMPDPLCCGHLFDRITEEICHEIVYQDSDSNAQLCWSSDLSRVFYLHWRFEGVGSSHKTLFIACFEWQTSLNSMRTLAYHSFYLMQFVRQDLFTANRPRFRTINTQYHEYLVMDIMNSFDWKSGSATQPEAVLARAIFTLRKSKLHWVPVNRNFLTCFPTYIGNQVRYAGYETSHFSLFHHRRVYNQNKVVCSLHRMDYRLL